MYTRQTPNDEKLKKKDRSLADDVVTSRRHPNATMLTYEKQRPTKEH